MTTTRARHGWLDGREGPAEVPADIAAKVLQAHDEKRLITCRVPYGGDIVLAVEKHMVDQAMHAWQATIAPEHRRPTLDSVLRSIKTTIKRVKKGKAVEPEKMDALAADVALWLGHELVFADGERHLVKGMSREDIVRVSQEVSDALEKAPR